ncbi:MarR family transcriptional regulator [Gordonia sp. (in: high G+C Gram-positive bacteria)]|uniref:MarR family transcriptional regulator n=1 Tax=Gordonia sp. (in: high G+C Gram-positive bacteria) TaxID=84139 RepID=UPI0016B2F473|nr:MarR family transcriptional regulator [Gordonia sp. (in: high G+C Gram-positive bacteria)]NLG45239.1 MarR family transcriptional regulator [Gordonia sp. (in: high G+C Gram-positive bacteria)]
MDDAAGNRADDDVRPGEIDAFETATRDLVGLALRSVQDLDVSLSQYRLLLTIHELGPSSSSACAAALGVVGSSITRLADRLRASGHLVRGTDPDNRSIVTLHLTDAGRDVVRNVNERRRRDLHTALTQLNPDARAACAAALQHLHATMAPGTSSDELRRRLPL